MAQEIGANVLAEFWTYDAAWTLVVGRDVEQARQQQSLVTKPCDVAEPVFRVIKKVEDVVLSLG